MWKFLQKKKKPKQPKEKRNIIKQDFAFFGEGSSEEFENFQRDEKGLRGIYNKLKEL